MKLLYVTNLPAPYRVAFFNQLGKQVDLTVLYQRKTANDRDKRWLADAAKTFQEVYLGGVPVGAASSFSPKIKAFLKDASYDAIIIGGYSTPTEMMAISYLKRKKIPYILSVDGGVPRQDKGLKKRLKSYFIAGAARYLSTGKAADECLIPYGAEPAKIEHYHFTSLWQKDLLDAPPTQQEKQAQKTALGLSQAPMVLAVGRLLDIKRYDLLIKTAAQKKDVQFVIVGGKADSYHQTLIENAKATNVAFVDFMSFASLSLYYRAADIFVMTSDADSWGLVIEEAMAHGLPIVASTGCGAAQDLIKVDQNGILFERGNENALDAALDRLLVSQEMREAFGKNSLTKIKEYTIEHEVLDHLKALERYIGK